MNYELAKKLKENGFPQKYPRYYEDGSTFNQMTMEHPRNRDIWEIEIKKVVYKPTLSELIEACGDGFDALYNQKSEWQAEADMKYGYGSTPEESVANLWLALNPLDIKK